MELADGTEVLRFDSDDNVYLLGEPIPFKKVRNWLKKLNKGDI